MHIITQQFSTTASADSMRIIFVAAVALALVCIVAVAMKKRMPRHVGWPFALIAIVTISTTGLLIGVTLDNFLQSESSGITRRSTHIEYWACGVELELTDPKTPTNVSIGEGSYYEFNDKVARFQGLTGEEFETPTLAGFQNAIGGSITATSLTLPISNSVMENDADGDIQDPAGLARIDKFVRYDSELETEVVDLENGATCGQETAELGIYVFSLQADGKTYTQRKITYPSTYVMNNDSSIDDCVIVEFDTPRAQTDRLCSNFGGRDNARCQDFIIDAQQSTSCDLRQVVIPEKEEE